MKIAVVYVYPQVDRRKHLPLAQRFAQTYAWSHPTEPHELHVMCNAGDSTTSLLTPFSALSPAPIFHDYDNQGWDIGAFQWAAENIPCDLMVFLGCYIHFHRSNWLEIIAESYRWNGPALYGCWAYLTPNWHVRTTAFWCPPQLLQAYPNQIGSSRASRYEFEHGNTSFTRFVLSAGLECLMVTAQGVFPFQTWTQHAPGPDDSLMLDQHTHR